MITYTTQQAESEYRAILKGITHIFACLSVVKIKNDMTEEEIAKIAASIDRSNKLWNSLSDEEKKKEAEKAENSRLWEDWTDCDCVANPKSRSSQKTSDH